MSSRRPIKSRTIQLKPIKQEVDVESLQTAQNERSAASLKDEISRNKSLLNELKEEQHQLIQKTEEDIKNKQEAWEEEKEVLIEETKKQAYKDGFEEGKRKSEQQYAKILQEVNDLVDLAKENHDKKVRRSEETIVRLGVLLAEKILNHKLEKEPDLYANIVEDVLKQLVDSKSIHIYVHPKNYEYVLMKQDEYEQLLSSDTDLSVFANQNLTETSCIIEHTYGKVDASIETQLNELEQSLVEIAMENTL